jgi:hypothetical protein
MKRWRIVVYSLEFELKIQVKYFDLLMQGLESHGFLVDFHQSNF